MIQGTTSHVVTIVTIVVGRGTPWPWSFQNKHVWRQLSVRMYNYNSIINMFCYDCRYILQQRFCFKFQGISLWISYEFQTLPLLKTTSPATWPCGFYSNINHQQIAYTYKPLYFILVPNLSPIDLGFFPRQTAYKREERPLAQQVIFFAEGFRVGLSLTPWKINMEPENDGLEDDFPFQLADFLVPC